MPPDARFLCGLQPVREAIKAHGGELERVLVEDARSPQLDALARFATDRGAKVERVPRSELDRLSRGGRHQGAAAFAPALRFFDPASIATSTETPLLVVLDEIEDPQNFGAIVRSAVALGATGVVFPEHRAAPLTAATFRASAGAVEHARLCLATSLGSAISTFKAQGVSLVGLDAQAKGYLADVDLTGPLALVVGAEGKGLRKSIRGMCDVVAKLPMRGPIDSLNASVAAAIALYEVLRQRQAAGPSAV